MTFELDDVPQQPARRAKPFPWGKLWLWNFSAVFAAILLVQVLNLIVGYALFNHFAGKLAAAVNKPAVEVKK